MADSPRATYDAKPRLMTLREVDAVRAILTSTYPVSESFGEFVLEVRSAAEGLGEFLERTSASRALMVQASAERLHAELIEWFGDGEIQFVVEVAEERLDTPFDGYVLVAPPSVPELFSFLQEHNYSNFFLMTYVPVKMWGYDVEQRDHAPSIEELKAHFGPYAQNIQPVTPPEIVGLDSRLRLYLMRHVSWSDEIDSVTFTLSERDGRVIGRS